MKGKNKKKTLDSKDVRQALIKKALGYDAKEVVEEYVQNGEGEVQLSKRKITTKCVPPDVQALKLLLDEETNKPIIEMTDEELEKEKIRLLKLLNEVKEGEK